MGGVILSRLFRLQRCRIEIFCVVNKKIATRAYLESIPQIGNFSLQHELEDTLCVFYSVNNFIQLSPFIREKPLYPIELFQEECKTFAYGQRMQIDCSGKSGFDLRVAKRVLDPYLDWLEFDSYHQGRQFTHGLQRVKDKVLEYHQNTKKLDDEIAHLLESMDSAAAKLEQGPYDKIQEFISLYEEALEGDDPYRLFYAHPDPEQESALWIEVKAILSPIPMLYMPLDNLPRATLEFGDNKRGPRKILEDARRNVEVTLQCLSNPVLRVKYTQITQWKDNENGFLDPDFTDEFTDARRHADRTLTNYGYILGVAFSRSESMGGGHAICVVRQYPFEKHGDQSLVVLDSGEKTVQRFPSYIEMNQYLRKRLPGGKLEDFLSIYGYSRKRDEPNARRGVIQSMYQQNLTYLNGLIAQETPAASSASSAASTGGGAGSSSLGGGQTFYSFFSIPL
jgi:hypothetical protein